MNKISNPGKKRILIIDDNTQIHQDFKKILLTSEDKESDLGKLEETILGKEEEHKLETYTIDCASQGEEGLKMVEESIKKKEPYAVAFIDVRMPPGLDGIETISRIWGIYPELQIVICTAYSDYSWEELFNKFGHTDKLLILKKPFDNIEVRQLTYTLGKKWELNNIASLKRNELEKKVEERTKELNETKARFQNLYNYAPDMYFSVNPKGIVLSVNKYGAEYLGYKPDELVGNSVWIVVYKEDLKEIQKQVSEIFSKKLIKSELEFRKTRKDGSIIWVNERTYLFLDDNGNPKELLIMCRDITERKNAKYELQQSEEKYRTMIEHSNDMIWTLDEKGEFTYFNKRSEELTDYKIEDAIGKTFIPIIFEDDLEMVQNVFLNTLAGNSNHYEVRIYDSTKKNILTLSVNTAPIYKDGKVTGTVSFGRDITKRKKMEEALQESEEKYRNIFEHSPFGIITFDEKGNPINANKEGLNILDSPSIEDTRQINVLKYPPLQKNGFSSNFLKCLKTGEVINTETKYLSKWGKESFIHYTMAPIHIKENRIGGILSIFEDISERFLSEKALHESEEKYRTLVESLEEGIISVDEKENFTFVNQTATKIYGYSKKELLKSNLKKVVTSEEYQKIVKQTSIRKTGKSSKYESKIIRKDGSQRITLVSATPLFDNDGKYIGAFGVINDITERKKAEKALQESEKRFRQFFANSPEYCFIVSLEGTILDINKSALKALGYLKEEIIGRPLLATIYTPSSQKKAQKLFMKWSSTGELKDEELDIITKNGKERTVLLSVDAIRSAKGEIIHSILVQRDITERIQAEKALKESEEILRNFVDFTPLGIWCFQLEKPININIPEDQMITEFFNSNCIKCNDTYANMMGVSKDEILGLRLSDAMPDTDENRDYLRAFIKNGFKLSGGISRELTKAGKEKYFSNSMVGVIKKGKLINAWGTQSDITERKQAEKIQSVLYNIANVVNITKDIQDLFIAIRDHLSVIVNTDNFYIALYDKEKDTFLLPYHTDEKDTFDSFPAGKTLTAYVVRTGKPLFGTEEKREKLIQAGEIEKGKMGAHAKIWVGVPLKLGKEILGVIAVQSYTNASLYAEKDLEILEFVSDEIALAITHKQAEENLKKKNKELEAFNNIAVGREIRMVALKKEINDLLKNLGKEPKYKIAK